MEFDYKKFAEEFLKYLPNSVKVVTLQSFTEEYQAYIKNNRANKTLLGVDLVIKKLLSYFSPIRTLDSIELKDVERFLDSLKKNAPKGIYNYHRTLRAMWNKGKQWNYVTSNPFEKVELKKRQLGKPVFVTEKQLEEILKYVKSDVVKDAVLTAFYSGCRLGEIVNLTWQDVKLKDDLLIIGNKDFETKGRKQRVVPMHPKVKEVLMSKVQSLKLQTGEHTIIKLPEKKHSVFGKGNGFKFTGDYFSRSFKRACRQAGVEEEIHWHCLRHGAATRMIMNGAPLPSVQRILGHSNIQTTMIYTHPGIEDLREAVNKL
ncbi:MAG: site-specific integrase [Ignavibacteriae bacterium]|nr:site-specific integrase [Ignavibacteriota bacterium]MCE7855112.1 site-specific integrase [Ignavibacteria bacterium CHB3]